MPYWFRLDANNSLHCNLVKYSRGVRPVRSVTDASAPRAARLCHTPCNCASCDAKAGVRPLMLTSSQMERNRFATRCNADSQPRLTAFRSAPAARSTSRLSMPTRRFGETADEAWLGQPSQTLRAQATTMGSGIKASRSQDQEARSLIVLASAPARSATCNAWVAFAPADTKLLTTSASPARTAATRGSLRPPCAWHLLITSGVHDAHVKSSMKSRALGSLGSQRAPAHQHSMRLRSCGRAASAGSCRKTAGTMDSEPARM
mmetsp:Transcript_86483/g.242081  ORF Transcript_86483/g.242081 Transcript_86483/m.242081 type:complete len:261 (-) Transcript_86483:143-925(-)